MTPVPPPRAESEALCECLWKQITTVVYLVEGLSSADGAQTQELQLYPSTSLQNFCYLLLDHAQRRVTLLYHAYPSERRPPASSHTPPRREELGPPASRLDTQARPRASLPARAHHDAEASTAAPRAHGYSGIVGPGRPSRHANAHICFVAQSARSPGQPHFSAGAQPPAPFACVVRAEEVRAALRRAAPEGLAQPRPRAPTMYKRWPAVAPPGTHSPPGDVLPSDPSLARRGTA
eukprot:scaffold1782_cov414-Prasinococcus_capsulatus_cf.AAC.9